MDKYKILAEKIEKRIKKQESFSTICFEELKNFDFSISLAEFEKKISDWLLQTPLPKQLNVYNSFGQPPITIFNNGSFVIDIYFWMNHDTSIHDHSFSGAFKVLYGRSIHEQFSIESIKKYAPDVMKTKIIKNSLEIIEQNHVQKIEEGNLFTHRLIHLDQPTVTLCIRTIDDHKKKQWHHFPNGLSVLKQANSEETLKQLFYLQYLYQQDNNYAFSFMTKLIREWDISTTMNLYEQLAYDSFGISDEIIQCFFDEVIKTYGVTDWFKIYQEFYQTMEDRYVEFEQDSPGFRILEHANNTYLTFEETIELLNKVHPAGIPSEYLDILNQLELDVS